MINYICKTCGVQYGSSIEVPEKCVICEEERQYVHPNGQSWTTLQKMKNEGYGNIIKAEEKGLHSLTTTPVFGIGQTAYHIRIFIQVKLNGLKRSMCRFIYMRMISSG